MAHAPFTFGAATFAPPAASPPPSSKGSTGSIADTNNGAPSTNREEAVRQHQDPVASQTREVEKLWVRVKTFTEVLSTHNTAALEAALNKASVGMRRR